MPLAEHDTSKGDSIPLFSSFNSRAPRGARRNTINKNCPYFEVSIHVPLAEHDKDSTGVKPAEGVSIHVPLAEHDRVRTMPAMLSPVSIHVPLAEHDT